VAIVFDASPVAGAAGAGSVMEAGATAGKERFVPGVCNVSLYVDFKECGRGAIASGDPLRRPDFDLKAKKIIESIDASGAAATATSNVGDAARQRRGARSGAVAGQTKEDNASAKKAAK